MSSNYLTSPNPLLVIAYWSNLSLSIIALLLSGFFGLLLLGSESSSAPNFWVASGPFLYTAITWVYLDILSQALRRPSEQRSILWLLAALVSGVVALVVYVAVVSQMSHGPRPIFLVPLAIGSISFIAVCRIALEKALPQRRKRTTSGIQLQ